MREGAVVDDRAFRSRHALTDTVGKRRSALAIEISLQTMADRLVQQDPGPTRSQHHCHRTRGRGYRFEIDQPLTNRFASELERLVARHQIRQRVTATHTGVALLTTAVLLNEHRNIEAHQRAHIGGKLTFAGSDEHNVVYRGNARRHVHNTWIQATRLAIHSLEPRNFIFRR